MEAEKGDPNDDAEGEKPHVEEAAASKEEGEAAADEAAPAGACFSCSFFFASLGWAACSR